MQVDFKSLGFPDIYGSQQPSILKQIESSTSVINDVQELMVLAVSVQDRFEKASVKLGNMMKSMQVSLKKVVA